MITNFDTRKLGLHALGIPRGRRGGVKRRKIGSKVVKLEFHVKAIDDVKGFRVPSFALNRSERRERKTRAPEV